MDFRGSSGDIGLITVCGRFTRFIPVADIARTFEALNSPTELQPSFNIAPSQAIYVVRGGEQRCVRDPRWGLVPSWSADTSRGSSMINARVETVREKPSFRNLLTSHRCVIPVNGYYEWKSSDVNQKVKNKQPFYFCATQTSQYCHDGMLAIAGLWTSWGSGDTFFESCTALTTHASLQISEIHHRMPLLLNEQGVEMWLSASATVDFDEIVIPDDLQMEIRSISSKVNNVRNDGPLLIEYAHLDDENPLSLF